MRKIWVLGMGLLGVASWVGMPVAHAAQTNEKAAMVGSEEVPGPGDPDGKATVTLVLDDVANTICYTFVYSGIDKPTAAHIHVGARGVAGPPAVTLEITKGDKGCVSADPTTLKNIRDNPAGHYVNIHNNTYPKGAVRGQLAKV